MKLINPKGPDTGSNRFLHGGSWNGNARSLVVSFRFSSTPGYHRYDFGFRIVCNEKKG